MVRQDPTHTPHPKVTPPLEQALEYVLEKFTRDFAINILVAAPSIYVNGAVDLRLFLPTVGLAAYRAYRDILPELISVIRGKE